MQTRARATFVVRTVDPLAMKHRPWRSLMGKSVHTLEVLKEQVLNEINVRLLEMSKDVIYHRPWGGVMDTVNDIELRQILKQLDFEIGWRSPRPRPKCRRPNAGKTMNAMKQRWRMRAAKAVRKPSGSKRHGAGVSNRFLDVQYV